MRNAGPNSSPWRACIISIVPPSSLHRNRAQVGQGPGRGAGMWLRGAVLPPSWALPPLPSRYAQWAL